MTNQSRIPGGDFLKAGSFLANPPASRDRSPAQKKKFVREEIPSLPNQVSRLQNFPFNLLI